MSNSSLPFGELGELAYQHASSALAVRQRVLDGLRARAGALLASATISTSFLGGEALRAGTPTTASWFAIACFVGVGLTTLAILWPRLDVEVTIRPILSAQDLRSDRFRSLQHARDDITHEMRAAYDRNERYLARLAAYVRLSSIRSRLKYFGG